MIFLLFLFVLVSTAAGRKGFGPTEQEWGFVTVREGAHMFWWLHYTTATSKPTEKPLIIWLQGGPGGSSTEYGNFEEIGPIDVNLQPRETTWVKHANILFVDNPVGTGFSYVDQIHELTTTNAQIADDFVALLQGFYKNLPQFEEVPLYIFCESYGGKMTIQIALHLYQAIQEGKIKSNFKGVGLGDSWISPADSTLTWAPYLYQLGVLDTQQLNKLTQEGQILQNYIDQGDWANATNQWAIMEDIISENAVVIDFYNVLTKCCNTTSSLRRAISPFKKPNGKSLLPISDSDSIMIDVQKALNISTPWGKQADLVFTFLTVDFMKPVTDIVERVLNETGIKVAVYNGQLDLIVDTPGTINWVDRLNYKGSREWITNPKTGIVVNNNLEGYQKSAGNLTFYWVLRAGHMVPVDNSDAMLYILKQVTDNFIIN